LGTGRGKGGGGSLGRFASKKRIPFIKVGGKGAGWKGQERKKKPKIKNHFRGLLGKTDNKLARSEWRIVRRENQRVN